MPRFETIWTFDTPNFHVVFDVAPEDMDPADSFEFQEDVDAVNNGDVHWFTARVRVMKNDRVIGEDQLGGCAYADIRRDFVESHWRSTRRNTLAMKAKGVVICDYFPDMVRAAIADARKTLAL